MFTSDYYFVAGDTTSEKIILPVLKIWDQYFRRLRFWPWLPPWTKTYWNQWRQYWSWRSSRFNMMVSILPDRPNIFLDVVQRVTHDFAHDLEWLVDGLRNHKQKYPKSLIFANSIRCVGEIFELFRSSLSRDGFVSGVRTYSMYHGQVGKE